MHSRSESDRKDPSNDNGIIPTEIGTNLIKVFHRYLKSIYGKAYEAVCNIMHHNASKYVSQSGGKCSKFFFE